MSEAETQASETREVYEIAIAVEPADIDEFGHVNNVVYLRWVQDVATAHWEARASREIRDGLWWFAVRHEIDYRQPARLGDTIQARTWVGAMTRSTSERFTEIRRAADGAVLAQARTVWCAIDPQTRRPVRLNDDLRALFGAAPAGNGNGA
jgi:acyl-CoA thioester hydrolase